MTLRHVLYANHPLIFDEPIIFDAPVNISKDENSVNDFFFGLIQPVEELNVKN